MEIQNNITKTMESGGAVEAKNYQSLTKILSIIIVSILVGMAICLPLDRYLPSNLSNSKKNYSLGYTSGFNAAKKIVMDSELGSFFKVEDNIHVISGVITAINGEKITLKSLSAISPFDTNPIQERKVTITKDTKFFQLSNKDHKVIQAEMAAFIKAGQKKATTTNQTSNVLPYVETVVPSSTIKIGDIIMVRSSENIKTLKEFTAASIQIEPQQSKK